MTGPAGEEVKEDDDEMTWPAGEVVKEDEGEMAEVEQHQLTDLNKK